MAAGVPKRREGGVANIVYNLAHELERRGHRVTHLFLDDPPDDTIEFGPLSSMIVRSDRAVLFRVIPKFAERTDFQVIEMAAGDWPEKPFSTAASEAVAEGLRCADTSLSWFSRNFADWYCSRMLVSS